MRTNLKHVPIHLISNHLSYKNDRVNNFQTLKDISWSDNLLNFLKTIESKYVLILLDDYIINRPVNDKRLQELYEFIKSEDGSYLQLFVKSDKKEYDFVSKVDNVIKRSINGPYRNSLQAAIWNKEELMKLIKPGESAWEFELIGNARSKKMSKPFFAITKDAPVTYLNCVEKKMFVKECLQEAHKLGFEMKPKKMPIYSQKEINKIRKKQSKF